MNRPLPFIKVQEDGSGSSKRGWPAIKEREKPENGTTTTTTVVESAYPGEECAEVDPLTRGTS